jgi:hypothetical protein
VENQIKSNINRAVKWLEEEWKSKKIKAGD